MNQVTIIGNSLAALVAVIKAGESGDVLWVKHSSRVGGHFSGIEISDNLYDVGMVALEPFEDLENSLPNISDLENPYRHNAIPIVPLAMNWLRRFPFHFNDIQIYTFENGHKTNDFYIADSLDLVRELPATIKSKIRDEIKLNENGFDFNFHPKFKLSDETFRNNTYFEYISKYFGNTYYEELIAPWSRSFNSVADQLIPSIEHRSLWLPIYYPETLLEALEGNLTDFEKNKKRFSVPTQLMISDVVRRLEVEVERNKRIKVINYDELQETNISDNKIFLGSQMDLYKMFPELKLSKASSRTQDDHSSPLSILIFESKEEISDDFVLNVRNDKKYIYRITFRKMVDKTVASVEIGNTSNESDESLIQHSNYILAEIIDLNFNLVKVLRVNIQINSVRDYNSKIDEIIQFDNFIAGSGFIGCIQSFLNSSFNDQICLGFSLPEKLRV